MKLNITNQRIKRLLTWGSASFAVATIALLFLAPAKGSSQGRNFPFKVKANGRISMEEIHRVTRRAPARDRITDEELGKIKDANPTPFGPEFQPTKTKMTPPRGDLYSNSELLWDGSGHTILPKRAILFVPDALKEKVLEAQKGNFEFWPKFSRENQSWIQPWEVSLDVAKGIKPLSEPIRKSIEKSPKIVVAVYNKFPISVLPPREPEEGLEQGEDAETAATESEGKNISTTNKKNTSLARAQTKTKQ